jgi:DNA-binding YbaB/EbfC family protein
MELDLGKLMEQAQHLSRELQGRQADLGRREVEGQSGAGLVTATMNGRGELLRVRIDPKTFAGGPQDQGLIEDLVVAAVNAAIGEVQKLQQQQLSSLGSAFPGLGLPGPGGGLR